MTVVARGAALYAATAGIDSGESPAPAAPPSGLVVRVEHPAVTADAHPFVVGRFLPSKGERLPRVVTLEREDGGFSARDLVVGAEGTFVAQVELARHRQNRFHLVAHDGEGGEIALRSPRITIVHGISIADPPLARTIGVASSDDRVHVYFEKGTPLPARRTAVHRTVKRVAAGAGQDAVAIPLVQGELSWAHLNRLIGTLEIRGERLRRDLPIGSRIEVTLEPIAPGSCMRAPTFRSWARASRTWSTCSFRRLRPKPSSSSWRRPKVS